MSSGYARHAICQATRHASRIYVLTNEYVTPSGKLIRGLRCKLSITSYIDQFFSF
jgi:hypothetical protein